MADGIFPHGFQRGAGAFFVVEGQETFALGIEIGPAGLLQDDGTAQGEVGHAAVAEPAAARFDVAVLGHAKFAPALGEIIAVALPRGVERLRLDDAPAVAEKFGFHRIVGVKVGGDFQLLRRLARKRGQLGELFRFVPVPFAVEFHLRIAVPVGEGRPDVARLVRLGVGEMIEHDRDADWHPGASGEGSPACLFSEVPANRGEDIVAGKVHVRLINLGPNLSEGGIEIDVDPLPGRAEHFPLPEMAGDVEEEFRVVGEAEQFGKLRRVAVEKQGALQAELAQGGVPMRKIGAAFRRAFFAVRVDALGERDILG